MIAEGKGIAAPNPVRIKLTGGDLVYLERIASKRKRHRAYSSSRSAWKNGVIKDSVMVGVAGEHAITMYLSQRKIIVSTDMETLNSGDGGIDFEFAGKSYQVKTRISTRNRFVRRVNEQGMLQPIVCDRFVFCSFDSKSVVLIDGWCISDVVIDSHFSKSARGNWWNTNIQDESLEPLSDLVLLMGMEASK